MSIFMLLMLLLSLSWIFIGEIVFIIYTCIPTIRSNITTFQVFFKLCLLTVACLINKKVVLLSWNLNFEFLFWWHYQQTFCRYPQSTSPIQKEVYMIYCVPVQHMYLLCHVVEGTTSAYACLYSGHSACNLGWPVLTLNLSSCDLRP